MSKKNLRTFGAEVSELSLAVQWKVDGGWDAPVGGVCCRSRIN